MSTILFQAMPDSAELAVDATVLWKISKLSDKFGAEIQGIDLSHTIPPELAQALRDAIETYHVIVIRDQHLNSDQQETFSECFGQVQEHVGRMRDGSRLSPVHEISNLDESNNPTDRPYLHATAYWHTDGAHFPVPPSFTVLHAIQLPPTGGDTDFADMTSAYEALPEEKKHQLETIEVIHSYGEKHLNIGGPAGKEAEIKDAPPVTHPLVSINPRTGRKSLYLGMYAVRVHGMEDGAARAFLKDLLDHATQPEFVFTQQWRDGDLIMWDNRYMLHRAVGNFDMRKHKRILRRTVVKGSLPL